MKRAKIIATGLCCVMLSAVCLLSGCTSDIAYVDELNCVEWRDDAGIFYLRAPLNGRKGAGTVTLNGKTYAAAFTMRINPPTIAVYLAPDDARELGEETTVLYSGLVKSPFRAHYSKEERTVYSSEDNVELFGIDIGKVKLTAYPLDESTVEPWELLFGYWEDGDGILRMRMEYPEVDYFLHRYALITVNYDVDESTYYTIKWNDEKRFCIYQRTKDYTTITDTTPTVAEGTGEYKDGKLTLTFTKDEIYDGKYPTITLLRD